MPFAKQLLQLVPLKYKTGFNLYFCRCLQKLSNNICATLGMVTNNPCGSRVYLGKGSSGRATVRALPKSNIGTSFFSLWVEVSILVTQESLARHKI